MSAKRDETGNGVMRRGMCATFALLAAIGMVGCASGTTNPGGGSGTPLAASVTMQVCDAASSGCGGSSAFSLVKIRDLEVAANWSNIAGGTHTQTIELVLPNGDLYQNFNASFLAPDAALNPQKVVQQIPIAGTAITQREITGKWKIRLSADGQTFTTQTIDLQP